MNVLTRISELSDLAGPVHLAVGVFDGVHLGHQKVIRRALDGAGRDRGTAVVVTFSPHPVTVLRPEKAPQLLISELHLQRVLERQGVANLLVIPFDQDFAKTPACAFVEALAGAAEPLKHISVGYGWRFGKGREGDIHLLTEMGSELGFGVTGLPAFEIGGEVVSSTLVRRAVREGQLDRARGFLGRPYAVFGEVFRGEQLGRTLGVPTANIGVQNEQLPPDGVYAVSVLHGEERLRGVGNLGVRPTVDGGGERRFEVHLIDWEGDLYSSSLEVEFIKFLRPEKKFASLDDLKEQIFEDIKAGQEGIARS